MISDLGKIVEMLNEHPRLNSDLPLDRFPPQILSHPLIFCTTEKV